MASLVLRRLRSQPLRTSSSPEATLQRPNLWTFVVAFLLFFSVDSWVWLRTSRPGALDTYLAIFWTLPTLASAIGVYGALATMRRMHSMTSYTQVSPAARQTLIVVIPTVARHDTLPALERVVRSTSDSLQDFFDNFRIDIVIEESCSARSDVDAIAGRYGRTRVMVVPAAFQTLKGTRFKARANEYASKSRSVQGEVRDDVWVLHMDDDTDVRRDTAAELARFLHDQDQAGGDALDLCQGVLCYPRELARNRFVWLADSIRPACDVSLFSATTGGGSPRTGLHGEMLMVRATVEVAIGWDFGPRTIVEDAQFALHFCRRYPGRSGWIPARSYGASPATVRDFIRQRERWVWGLLELISGRSQRYHLTSRRCGAQPYPSRSQGVLMLHNTVVWACAPLGHPGVVLLFCAAVGDFQTSPAALVLAPLWAFNAAYGIWLYWEGLKLNASASARPQRLWWEQFCVLGLSPVFTMWEVVGIVRGVWRFLRRREPKFTVIAKPT